MRRTPRDVVRIGALDGNVVNLMASPLERDLLLTPDEALALAASRLATSRSTCILTGSGISAESGIPTFRAGALVWRDLRAQDLATPEGFARDPALVWTWYNERLANAATAEPNAGHRALAELETLLPDVTLVTQNVDSLHARAGSSAPLELHGHLRDAHCSRCDARRALDGGGLPLGEIGHACGGKFRPSVVWFGETLPSGVFERAVAAAGRCDVVLVVGTSGLVNPAAMLCTEFAGDAFVIEVNPEPSAIAPHADVRLAAASAVALPRLLAETRARMRGSDGAS